MTNQWRGALTALITPFTESDEVDISALKRLVEAQIDQGIDGLVACGTTGETPTLSREEHERTTRVVVEAARGRVPVVVGVGSNATKRTIETAKRASAWGVQAILVVCPFYNKPTQEGLFLHFKAIFEETGLPIIAYNVPGRTASDLMPETIARLVEVSAIVAVKDATANMDRATQTLNLVQGLSGPPRSFALLSGDDFSILPFVALGGTGAISVVSNLCPRDVARLVRLTENGQWSEARPLHGRLVELTRALFSTSSPIPVKAALALAGFCLPNLRLPLDPTPPRAIVERVEAAMHRYRQTQPPDSLEGFIS